MLIRTKTNDDYSTIDDRALTHDGVIVDVGCAGWDMYGSLIGKKRIIGVDPFENPIEGTELFQGLLGAFNGIAFIKKSGDESSAMSEGDLQFPTLSWKAFCKKYGINKVSVLKLNIEGAEYPLLNSMDSYDFQNIDQIAVSFHDWLNPKWKHLTASAIHLLESNNFTVTKLQSDWGWYLALKK